MYTYRASVITSVIANILLFADSWQSAIAAALIAVVSVSAVYAIARYLHQRVTA